MKKYIFILLSLLMLYSCSSSESVVSKNVDLGKYEYASIINNETYHIPAELMVYEIQLFDAVEASRLQLIGEHRIHELTPLQQSKLLLVKYDVSHNDDAAIVTVNFIDYMTGRPVASCRGTFGLGLDRAGDLNGAIKKVEKQISKTFPKR